MFSKTHHHFSRKNLRTPNKGRLVSTDRRWNPQERMTLPTWGTDQGPACTPSGPAHLEVGQGVGLRPKGLCILIGLCPLNSFIGRKLYKWQTVEEMSYLNLGASHPEAQRVLPHDKQ